MTTIQEMVAKFRERIESDPKFNERLSELKAKAEAEQKAKEEAQAAAKARFAELFKMSTVKNDTKVETEAKSE